MVAGHSECGKPIVDCAKSSEQGSYSFVCGEHSPERQRTSPPEERRAGTCLLPESALPPGLKREGLRVRGLSSPCALFFKSLVVADFNSRFWKSASNKATEIFKQHHQPSRYCDYWSLSSLKSLVLLNKVARLFMGLHRNSFGELVPQQTIITTVFCDVS